MQQKWAVVLYHSFSFSLDFIIDEGDGKSQGFADYSWKFCGFVV